MKMKLVKVLGLVAAFACAEARAAVGDVWEIQPCDEYGVNVEKPLSSAANTLPAGTNIYFKVRLAALTTHAAFAITPMSPAATSTMIDPMGIGIYVGGKLRYAYRRGDFTSGTNNKITDVVFEYKTEPGDFALPIRLATENGPADQFKGGTYIFDPYGKWKYTSTSLTDPSDVRDCNWWFYSGPASARGQTKLPTSPDYSLKDAGFYLRTIDFDNQWEEPGVCWRSVHKGGTATVGANPSLVSVSGPTELTTLYVWSTNEAAVKVVSDRKVLMRVGGTADNPVMKEFSVAEVTFAPNQIVPAEFKIQGVESNLTSRLILSATDHFNYGDTSTEDLIEDFVSVPVACVEPLPASLIVRPVKTSVEASSDYMNNVTELDVALTEPFTNDLVVTIEPTFENAEAQAAHANWRDYLRVSSRDTLDTLETATNFTFTIPKGELYPFESGSRRKVYLFALRSDKWVDGPQSHLLFTARTTDAAAVEAIKGLDGTPLSQLNITGASPVIIEPTEGEALSTTAVRGKPMNLQIKVSDTYADQISTNRGYKILIWLNKSVDGDYMELEGEYAIGSSGYLYKLNTETGKVTTELPKVTYTVEGVNESLLKVKSPTGDWIRESDANGRKFTVNVKAPAGCVATVLNDQLIEDDGEHGGQGDVQLTVTLTQKNQTGSSIYAFLEPLDEASSNAVDCSFLATDGHRGLEIGDGNDVVTGFFMMIDGCTSASDSMFRYRVVLRDQPAWEDGVEVTSYSRSNNLILTSKNVVPTISGALMGLNETDENGEFAGIEVPMNIDQYFSVVLDEPGLADLRATGDKAFQVQWKFSTPGQQTVGPIDHIDEAGNIFYKTGGIIYGNPTEEAQHAWFRFTKAGRWTVTVNAKDKDMTSFKKEKTYTFYVDVVDKPTMSVTSWVNSPSGSSAAQYLYEDYSVEASDYYTASLKVNLSFNKCGFPMKVQLKILPPSSDPKDGILKLATGSQVAEVADNVYELTFGAGVTELEIPIQTLDGTKMTYSPGFLTAITNITDSTKKDPDSGESVCTYYIADPKNKAIKVYNAAPSVNYDWLYPEPGTTNQCAIGEGQKITWDLTDVKPDFETPGKGISIVINAPNGETRTITDSTKTAGEFTPRFAESGVQRVQITFKDADGGQMSYTWYYDVAKSKNLKLVANGPASGNGTPLSKKYLSASGHGEGRVWASGDSGAVNFTHTINCGESKSWNVYAYGYKIGDIEGRPFHYPDGLMPDETGYYSTRDLAVDKMGTSGTENAPYEYLSDGRDSFLYTWLQVTRTASKDSGSSTLTDGLLNGSILPETASTTASFDSGAPVGLPEEAKEGKYDDTLLEAVFSKEWLASDNMGDINQDGVPDIYFSKYWFSQPAAAAEGGEAAPTVDDLASYAKNNDDGDVLPALLDKPYAGITSNSPIFSAKMEIRGYGDCLNDAPALRLADGTVNPCGIAGLQPKRVYADPDVNSGSTLSKVEWLAWVDYAAVHGLDVADSDNWSKWSPERPTDPTKADTDDDGFDDGFEYWFWYRAYVGYLDESGNHRYMTGRRYSPANPGSGEPIPSAEIARLFDPIIAYPEDAQLRDTDNDGLPDIYEFLLGTNPVDFDTDGDGLPDGYEVFISGTDPLKAVSDADALSDTMRNYDGDAMAFSQIYMESDGHVLPVNLNPPSFSVFALIDEVGMTDGVQYYAVRGAVDWATALAVSNVVRAAGEEYKLVSVDGAKYLVESTSLAVAGGRLATDYAAFTVTNDVGIGETTCATLRLKPVTLQAGTRLDGTPTDVAEYQYVVLAEGYAADVAQTAWFYGNGGVSTATKANTLSTMGGFGMLTLGRYQAAPKDVPLAALPAVDDKLALIHYLVYQEYGFDPRTAWSAESPLNVRWGQKAADGSTTANTYNSNYGYAGLATRTRQFTAYDEFLVSSFFFNTSTVTSDESDSVSPAVRLINFWKKYSTNPHGPGEASDATLDENGADTDKDGVPDGWELYVMGGNKLNGDQFHFVSAYDDRPYSYFSPFDPQAKIGSNTDNGATSGDSGSAGDADGLNEWEEFAGTDTTLYYADYSPTITRPDTHTVSGKTWLNKFFPTDPWNSDTDGDGITDSYEIKSVMYIVDGYIAYGFNAANFLYGTPTDNGSACIPGGGLNPCSIDTDRDGLPDKWEAQYAGTFDSETGIQDKHHGILNGMDGTVSDAFTRPWSRLRDSYVDSDDCPDCINRDYDRDGLENWQEYLTGTMRCWRYDDPISRWDATPVEAYFDWNSDKSCWEFNLAKAVASTGCADANEFWYKTLVDSTSKIYNPHLVMDQSPAGSQYFTRVKNGFDPVFSDEGTYYFFYDGVDHKLSTDGVNNEWLAKNVKDVTDLDKLETLVPCPSCYMGTSPIEADSDHDGMDDYYELFHGLNPLLGASGVPAGSGKPCDLVYTAWRQGDYLSPVQAWREDATGDADAANYWTSSRSPLAGKARGTGMDFTVYPWLNGMASADPDGDDIRNSEEAIRNVEKSIAGRHTDPTPLWMTDSTYTNSLVRRFFRMPARFAKVVLNAESFQYAAPSDGLAIVIGGEDAAPALTTYYFRDFDGFVPEENLGLVTRPAYFAPFAPDKWGVAGQYRYNWAYSFEENEGYDTDHDGTGDLGELQGRANGVTDPQNFDSPQRRQAMYFPGANAALQTLPLQEEVHALGGHSFRSEPTFRQFTVECWAYPESSADAVLVERPVWVDESKAADEELVRKNFQLAIKGGRWYAEFDTTGTEATGKVFANSGIAVSLNTWTHLAATYDGNMLRIYVNGVERNTQNTSVKGGLWPAVAQDAIRLSSTNGTSFAFNDFSYDKSYAYSCILIGASLKTYADFPSVALPDQWIGHAIDVTQGRGWGDYKNFYKGYIDEVRIWDGARTVTQINETMRKRMTADDVVSNRSTFYESWTSFGDRYSTAEPSFVVPELRHLFSFDATFAADNAGSVAQAPAGFLTSNAAKWSRPDDWTCRWWKRILDTFGSVYGESKWVTWIHDTVAHAVRYDDTTLDSFYLSKDFEGGKPASLKYLCTAEPVSHWTQMTLASGASDKVYRSTAARHQFVYSPSFFGNAGEAASFWRIFEFNGRNASQFGADLLPLGGAYVKYCDNTVGMWDGQGASTNWELTGTDADGDGLADWWEAYAVAKGYVAAGVTLDWNTKVMYAPVGREITAGEAYMRDLARGLYQNGSGVADDSDLAKYRQVYDLDGNTIPDWWEKLYGLSGEPAMADSDNDGLPNYVEYLLSEVFKFKGVEFSPVKAKSVDENTLDYFIPIGSLYVGEIFTDHDLVDDEWEDVYADSYASRLKYDAFADADEDGWCNRSEVRYSKMCMATVADRQSHYAPAGDGTSADQLMADYPIPTIALKLNYNGVRADLDQSSGNASLSGVRTAPIVVQVTSDESLSKTVDATFRIAADTSTSAGTGTSSQKKTASDSARTRYLGKWSNRRVIGTLTPGNISVNSLALEFCYDPTSVKYTWSVMSSYDGYRSNNYIIKTGTRLEYEADRRKYGEFSVMLLSTSSSYSTMAELSLRSDEQTGIATWIHSPSGMELGTVNLMTGAFDINLGVLAGAYINTSTNGSSSVSNATQLVSAEEQTYRIAYSANPSVGIPRQLYLGEADQGHVREGKNTLMAWSDLNGNGFWDAGEPFAVQRGVDISWRGTTVEMELTDTSPIFDRLKLDTAESSRKVVNGKEGGTSESPNVATNSTTRFNETHDLSGGLINHVRVVPYLVRGMSQDVATTPDEKRDLFLFSLMENRVVAEFDVNAENGNVVHEGYFLKPGEFDIDWEGFVAKMVNNKRIIDAVGDISAVTYRLVLGDNGAIGPIDEEDSQTLVNALPTVVERRYELKASRTRPTTVTPGAQKDEVVYDASPSFTWRLDEPVTGSGRFGCSYTAFNIQVKDTAGKVVYDSGYQRTPAANQDGSFTWKAPLYVDDKLPSGVVFSNKTDYTWAVSMYNAKFREPLYSAASRFRMQVQTNGYVVGSARTAVRYFGPKETYSQNGAVVRVRAYESPDFSGRPVAAGYVAEPDSALNGLSVTGRTLTANCYVNGLSAGTYYFQAWIDSNNNQVCDPWETSGYLCNRDGSTPDALNPVGVKFGQEVGEGDLLEIYLEDADTDGDGLPDGWEYALYGNLDTKGVEMLSETPAGERVVSTNLTGALELQLGAQSPTAGLAGRALDALSSAGTLALALGVNPVGYSTFAAAISGSLSEELIEDGVKISSLSFANGKVTVAVEAETTSAEGLSSPLAASLAGAGELAVKCYVSYSTNAADWSDWALVKTITVGAGAQEVDVSDVVPSGLGSCFIKIKLEK